MGCTSATRHRDCRRSAEENATFEAALHDRQQASLSGLQACQVLAARVVDMSASSSVVFSSNELSAHLSLEHRQHLQNCPPKFLFLKKLTFGVEISGIVGVEGMLADDQTRRSPPTRTRHLIRDGPGIPFALSCSGETGWRGLPLGIDGRCRGVGYVQAEILSAYKAIPTTESIPSASRLSISCRVRIPPATASRRRVACRMAATASIGIPAINPSVSMCV